MPGHDIIVIGGSAGSFEVLKAILPRLPADFDAAVFVVTHLPSGVRSRQPEIFRDRCALPVRAAEDGEPVRPGQILFAPGDSHLLLIDGRVQLGRGPRENMSRPSIDPLFRSAALAYGPRVIGVVLTGMLDDGAAGLVAVRRCGGLAVVQDPADAEFDEMPRNAIAATSVDHLAAAEQIADLLVTLHAKEPGPAVPPPRDLQLEVEIAAGGRSDAEEIAQIADLVPMTCPSCQGSLSQIKEAQPLRFRCQVGHAFTAKQLEAEQENAVDEALRIALRVIDERAELVSRMAVDAAQTGRLAVADLYRSRAEEYRGYAETIRRAVLLRMRPEGDA